MRFWRTFNCLPRTCHLRRWHRHGPREGTGGFGLATTSFGSCGAGVPGPCGLLLQVCLGLRLHCGSTNGATQEGRLLLEQQGGGGFSGPQGRGYIRACFGAARFRTAVRRRVRCINIRFWSGTDPRQAPHRLLQPVGGTTSSLPRGIRARAHQPGARHSALTDISLGPTFHGADRPLQPQVSA
jgi:hypothetical protein